MSELKSGGLAVALTEDGRAVCGEVGSQHGPYWFFHVIPGFGLIAPRENLLLPPERIFTLDELPPLLQAGLVARGTGWNLAVLHPDDEAKLKALWQAFVQSTGDSDEQPVQAAVEHGENEEVAVGGSDAR